jgi:sugar lactone lactonase YvrE
MDGSGHMLETLAGGGAFFECPRWHDGRLWVSDYWRHQVLAVSPGGAAETVAEVPWSPSGQRWLPDGTLLVASLMDAKLLRVEDGATVEHADLAGHGRPAPCSCASPPTSACRPTRRPGPGRPAS